MSRVEINSGGHSVVVDDPNGQRADVCRDARKLWDQTRVKPNGAVGFGAEPAERKAGR